MKLRLLPLLALTVAAGLSPLFGAVPMINSPDFIIPLAGQSGTLTLYADGRAPLTSGFNVLRSQNVTLPGNSVSSGSLTLNLHFTGLSLDPAYAIENARLQFRLMDMDFVTDNGLSGISLTETAVLTAINGVPLATPRNLASHLVPPVPGVPVLPGSQFVSLPLEGSTLPANVSESLVFTFRLTATMRSRNPQPTSLRNMPENIVSDIAIVQAPEPSTWALIGLGLMGLVGTWRARRRQA
jgi:hypothetical protein